MFTVYYANQIASHKDLLAQILQRDPNPNPFAEEIVLVQSTGMAQWLQMRLAEELGVTANIQFPYPTRFLWQQYRVLFPALPKENIFERNAMVWRLMRLLPDYLAQPPFQPLASYLKQQDQLKQYQLASKIADLFDQYLVYRPHWLVHWENNELAEVLAEIQQSPRFNSAQLEDIQQNMHWQSVLWNALVTDIKHDTPEIIFNTSHRAYLQQRYFEKLDHLTDAEKAKLPRRIFVFGISSLPKNQLLVLNKLSNFCHIHLFFTNPSEMYWGNDTEDRLLEKFALKQTLSQDELAYLFANQGNPLLTTWGKQGKEFLNLLIEQAPQEIAYYTSWQQEKHSLLEQVKNAILKNKHQSTFYLSSEDRSIQLHACHSKMREVEVLHNQLLALFEQYPDLSPKDIIVMSPDIDSYAPYINAVFSVYERSDPRFIPFTLSDQKLSYIDPIIASFLTLLSLKEKQFTVEEILGFFDVKAIRVKYQLTEQQLFQLREWINAAGIRAGLTKQQTEWNNYNSWENGLDRLLLGISLKAENNSWQDILAFDQSYGLSAELTGQLAKFLENLTAWIDFLQLPQPLSAWQDKLLSLLTDFYQEETDNADIILNLQQTIEHTIAQITQTNFSDNIHSEIIEQLFIQQLSEQRSNLQFLVGKVNFCTLLPMRAIPFKVVCLLGMNEGDFPRQAQRNHFDLMQYAPQKGDRAKRDDDRYLFLEALLSAQHIFYISYIGQSLTESREKLPSILVAQLSEYLAQRLADLADFPITRHAMTAFSPNNMTQGRITYQKEWLNAKSQRAPYSNFLNPLVPSALEYPDQIELTELIAYLQAPLKFYFNRQLGVYFEQHTQAVRESEPFQLSSLDSYLLLEELLPISPSDSARFFQNAKLQGNLPACHFAELSQQQLFQAIQPLQEALADYLNQPQEVVEIAHSFSLNQQNIRLVGNIPHRFNHQVIQWRVGKLRDKDIIQTWIYTLILIATTSEPLPIYFYFREKDRIGCLTFTPLEKSAAQQLLTQYLNDYLTSFTTLKWAVTDNLQHYIATAKTGKTSGQDQCQRALETTEDVYLQRVLRQSNQLDFNAIHQQTLTWFEPMIAQINII